KLAALEALIHPLVRKELLRLYEDAKKKKATLFVVEEPLLFELRDSSYQGPFSQPNKLIDTNKLIDKGLVGWYDATIAVTCPEAIAINRSHLDPADYQRRAKRHFSQQEKQAQAMFHI